MLSEGSQTQKSTHCDSIIIKFKNKQNECYGFLCWSSGYSWVLVERAWRGPPGGLLRGFHLGQN